MKQTYLVELDYRDISTIRDALDVGHAYLMLTRVLMRALGQEVRTGPGPLRRRIVALQKDFPRFDRYDPDPCFGIHNFVTDEGWDAVELPANLEAPAHCTECGAELIHAKVAS